MRKPTLIIFVANFQTPYQSFRLFLEAVSDIESCKSAGAWVAVIIVDPQANRQPRLQDSDLRLSRDALNMMRTKNGRESILFNHIRPSKNYVLQDHVDFIRKLDKVQRNFLFRVEDLHRERAAGKPLEYNQLALLYAKVLASHRDDGFKINYYADLVRHPVFTSVKRLLTKPTSWFGEGEISSSCPDTKHFLERTIWSPDFFETNVYPNSAHCEWNIKARKGFFLTLQFDYIKTEEIYDVVVVYDGFEKDLDTILGNFSGDYTEINALPSVNSTEELMLVHFKSDAGHPDVGFRATWTPHGMPDRIDDAEVLFLVDVSASLYLKHLKPIKGWIKKATKSFYFKGKPESQKERMARLGIVEEPKGTTFGLIAFDVMNHILSSMTTQKSRSEFFNDLNKITHTMRTTYLGHALDFARLRQFYLLSGTDIPFPAHALARNKQNTDKMEKEKKMIPRRVIFIFSDANSNDNPAHAARRLCQADIVPVLIAIGRVSIRGKTLMTSYCGLTFDINVPLPQVIYAIKHHLGLISNATTTAMPPLPTKPTFPTRIRFTKPLTTTTTTTTTTPKPFYVRQTLPPQPQPRPITYFYFAGTLAGIGFLELLIFLATLYYNCCTDSSTSTRPSDSEESIVLEDEEGNILPKELPEYPAPANSFFDRFAAPFAKRKKNVPDEAFADLESKKSYCCELKANSQDANKK